MLSPLVVTFEILSDDYSKVCLMFSMYKWENCVICTLKCIFIYSKGSQSRTFGTDLKKKKKTNTNQTG